MKHVSLASISVLLTCAALGCAADSADLESGRGGATATGGSSIRSGGTTGSGGQLGSGGSAGTTTGSGGSAGTTKSTSTGGSAGTTSAADAGANLDAASSVCRPHPPCAAGWFHYQDTMCPYPPGSQPGCSSRGDGLCYQECKTSSDCTDPSFPNCSGLTIFNGSDVGQSKYVCTSSVDFPACPATATGGAGGGGGSGRGGASGSGGIQAAGGRPGAGGAAGGGGTAVDGAAPVDGNSITNLDGAVACSTSSPSLACKTDSDCCLVFDQCWSHLSLVAKADVESVTACYRTMDTFWCTSCCPPIVETWCQNGQCVAAAVSTGCGQPHCGRLSADAGTTVSMSASKARSMEPAVTVDAAVVTGTWFGCSGI